MMLSHKNSSCKTQNGNHNISRERERERHPLKPYGTYVLWKMTNALGKNPIKQGRILVVDDYSFQQSTTAPTNWLLIRFTLIFRELSMSDQLELDSILEVFFRCCLEYLRMLLQLLLSVLVTEKILNFFCLPLLCSLVALRRITRAPI